MDVSPRDDGKSFAVNVHIANIARAGGSGSKIASLFLALPDLLDETQNWNEFELILNPKSSGSLLPEGYCCPITSKLMREPVTTSDGHTYEREAIEKWLENHDTSPGKAEPLESKKLTPVLFVKNVVGQLLDKHPELRDSKDWYLPESWVRELGQVCEASDEAAIRELVGRDRRLLVHTFDSVHEGKTALQLAVLSSEIKALEVVVELLEGRKRGLALAALLQTNAQGHSPLHQALLAHRDHETLLQIMSWMGKSLNMIAAPPGWPLLAQNSQTQNTLNALLLWSVEHGDPVKAGCLLRLRACPNVVSNGLNVLYLAVVRQTEIPSINGGEVAHRKQVVKLLLEARANPNALNEDGEDGPLHLALKNDLLDTALEFKKEGAQLDLNLIDGTTPLHVVAGKATTMLADALWDGDGNANVPPKQLLDSEHEALSGENGSTPLHCAAEKGSIAMLHWLVARGAQTSAVNAKMQSILHVAALCGQTQFAEATKKLSVEPLFFPDCDGNTPLHLAAQADASDVMRWLLVEYEALPSRNRAGQLPRQLAVSCGHSTSVRIYDETVAMLKAKEEALLAEQQGALGQLLLRQQRVIEMQQARLEQQENEIMKLRDLAERTSVVEAQSRQQGQEFMRLKELLKPFMEEQGNLAIGTFLTHVVRGEYKDVEAMIQCNQHVLFCKGNVTDLSERTFHNITGFQYAVWSLDWRMWQMMLKYLPKQQAVAQYRELNAQGTAYGARIDWQQLIDAYDALQAVCAAAVEAPVAEYLGAIARAQRLLPVHVTQEYAQSNFHDSDFNQCEIKTERSVQSWFIFGSNIVWLRRLETNALCGISSLSPDLAHTVLPDQLAVAALLQRRCEQRARLGRDLES